MNYNRSIRFTFAVTIGTIILLLWSVFLLNSKIQDVQSINKAFQVELKEQKQIITNLEKRINDISIVSVDATAYNSLPGQTDDNPNETACGNYPRIGRIAVSQDLFYSGWTCGKWVAIQGLGLFQIDDVMHKRKTKQIDIFKYSLQEAIAFGLRRNLNAVLLTAYDEL